MKIEYDVSLPPRKNASAYIKDISDFIGSEHQTMAISFDSLDEAKKYAVMATAYRKRRKHDNLIIARRDNTIYLVKQEG